MTFPEIEFALWLFSYQHLLSLFQQFNCRFGVLLTGLAMSSLFGVFSFGVTVSTLLTQCVMLSLSADDSSIVVQIELHTLPFSLSEIWPSFFSLALSCVDPANLYSRLLLFTRRMCDVIIFCYLLLLSHLALQTSFYSQNV